MKELILKNGRYYDENNNSWSSDLETVESATLKSRSMSYCSSCSDCCYCCYCSDCSDCCYCSSCSDCSYCSSCSDCSDCCGYKSNPVRYFTPKIGSRDAQTAFYWTNESDIQVVCGCFRGNLDNFESKVKVTHKNTKHLESYLNQIEIVKFIIEKNK